jgi:hypothetical protein
MSDSTIIAIVGIAVSGVVGPVVTVWASGVNSRRQFVRDREDRRRHELLALLDEAASLLGLGAIRLRQTREHQRDDTTAPEEVQAWPEQVYALGQRLRLRLGAKHAVVVAYETVRTELEEAGKVGLRDPDGESHENAILRFEAARGRFLDECLLALNAEISSKEPKA